MSVAVLVLAVQAFADSPAPPRDFKKVTGNYVFVMLAPDEPGQWTNHDPEIRKAYKQSGLYRNDGSTTPLWVVDWYAFEVFPSSDGEHLVRMGPWAASTGAPAVSFYRNGKEVKTYRIKDLVRDESRLIRSVSFLHWRGEVKYDDKKGVLFLKTIDGQAYRFSVETGQIQP
jgi:hypothetical protein